MKSRFIQLFKSPSVLVVIAIAAFVLGVHNNQNSLKPRDVIKWDVVSYYTYLPAIFVEKDITLGFITDENSKAYNEKHMYVPHKTAEGKWVIKAAMGMAVLYAPFFLIAHSLAHSMGYEANGFSEIYQLAVLLSGLFYLIIGLFYLRKCLLLFYSEKITTLTLLAVYFGTNLLCYSTLDPAMSHEYNFCLFAVFIYYSIQWLKGPKIKYSIVLGLVLGLMVLVRPLNGIFLLFPVLYGVIDLHTLKHKINLFRKHPGQCLSIALLAFLVVLPQLIYWKTVSGQYFFNSYIGERFYFLHPHIMDCLVGFRKGWLLYTPIMIMALAGIYFVAKYQKQFFVVAVVLVPLYFYVVSSWWCWWFGGSFGLRAMIDVYPLLAIALAAFFSSLLYTGKISSKILSTGIVFFILLNLFQTIQYHYNIIHYDSMTMKAYTDRFGKISKADCDSSLLLAPDYEGERLERGD